VPAAAASPGLRADGVASAAPRPCEYRGWEPLRRGERDGEGETDRPAACPQGPAAPGLCRSFPSGSEALGPGGGSVLRGGGGAAAVLRAVSGRERPVLSRVRAAAGAELGRGVVLRAPAVPLGWDPGLALAAASPSQ